MAIEGLKIPYPDFQLNAIIEPEEFDLNNRYIVDKINQFVSLFNHITDGASTSGASLIDISPITRFTGGDVQSFLEQLIAALENKVSGSSASEYLGSRSVSVGSGNTIYSQLAFLKNLIDTVNNGLTAQINRKADIGVSHTKAEVNSLLSAKANASEVYTKAELQPYLSGGDTHVRYDVFTIVNPDAGNKTFTYRNKSGNVITGTLTDEGYQVFTLEAGSYTLGVNQIKMIVGDILHRSVASGGLKEIDSKRIALTVPEGADREITIEYFERIGVAGETTLSYGTVKPLTTSGAIWFKVVG